MKRILIGLLALGSISALASCPDLAGTYPVCKSKGGSLSYWQNIVFDQTVNNGIAQYTLSSDGILDEETTVTVLIADENIRTKVEEEDGITVETKVSCADNKLIVSETLIDEEGTKIYGTRTYSKDGNKLIINSTDDWREAGAGVIKSLEACQ